MALDEEDPVTAEYDVFITPDLAEQLYLLQYPNRSREQPYNAGCHSKPLGMRIKPKSGFIEVDVPMNVHANFDRTKGVVWGEALRKAKEEGADTFGLAAGFQNGAFAKSGGSVRPGGRAAAAALHNAEDTVDEDDSVEQLLHRFEDANDKGHVMNKQTLGGQILKDEAGKPIYMLGAFRGEELHLTKVSGIVQMRPQFHHLDAKTQLDDASRLRERYSAEPPRPAEPRAVQMAARGPDGESMDIGSTKAFLELAQTEPWTKLRYHDESAAESYEMYHEKMFVQQTSMAEKLVSSMTNEQYLDAISAPRVDPSGRTKKRPLTKRQMHAIDESEESETEEQSGQAAAVGDSHVSRQGGGLEQAMDIDDG